MKAIQLTETIHSYILQHAQSINPALPRLATETRSLPGAGMQIAPDQGALMYLFAKMIGARRILELGCFTGYSAICMASALPADGKLVTLDVNKETTKIAQRYFVEAGVAKKIELRLSPGLDELPKLLSEFGAGSFDLMFIDADKGNMLQYYEWGLKLLRSGGLILADNVLWGGDVADLTDLSPDTVAIRNFNTAVHKDTRVESVLANIADGLFVCRKI